MALNTFETDATRNSVFSACTGLRSSRFEKPYPLLKSTLLSCTTVTTAPGMCLAAMRFVTTRSIAAARRLGVRRISFGCSALSHEPLSITTPAARLRNLFHVMNVIVQSQDTAVFVFVWAIPSGGRNGREGRGLTAAVNERQETFQGAHSKTTRPQRRRK